MNLPRRILVVDDDDSSIKVIRDHLMSYDFEVDDLRSSTKVLDHLHTTNDYGLFIFDVNMPNKDGITLASQIRHTLKSTVPILFVSGDINEETSARIRRLSLSGIVEFLKKGEFNSKILFNTCIGMMKEHHQLRSMDELKGRISHLQDGWNDGLTQINDFIERFEKKAVITPDHCDAKAEAIVKAVRSDVIGIMLGKTKSQIDKVVEEEIAPKIAQVAAAAAAPPSPDIVANAIEQSLAFSVLKWAIITIATIYGSWLAYTHLLAAGTKSEVTEIKTGQVFIKDMMKQQNTNIEKMQTLLKQMRASDGNRPHGG